MKAKFVGIKLALLSVPFLFYQCTEPEVFEEVQEQEIVLKSSDIKGPKVKTSFKMSCSNFNFDEIEEAGGILDKIYLRTVSEYGEQSQIIQIWDSVEVFNLLDMNAGIMVDIGFVPIPEGVYGQAIVNMKEAWVVYKGDKYKCYVPGGKMILDFKKPLNVATQLSPEVLIDIDVSNSFVPIYGRKSRRHRGDQKPLYFVFKPVVRVVNTTYAGRMVGAAFTPYYQLVPGVAIQLNDGTDTYQTYTLNDTVYDEFGIEYLPGYYSLNGIPAGTYTATASKDGYQGSEMEVTIVEGNFTEASFLVIPN